jgi:signal transduction histidine kinase
MGLAIRRSILDAHGGRLWADANEPSYFPAQKAGFWVAAPGI